MVDAPTDGCTEDRPEPIAVTGPGQSQAQPRECRSQADAGGSKSIGIERDAITGCQADWMVEGFIAV